MNTKFRLSFLLAAILVTSFSYAQPSYREGFVVNNSGDTMKGWIDYRQWERNPKSISFKKDLFANDPIRFTINDLSYFQIAGSDRYVRAVVNKDMRPVQLDEISPTDRDSLVIDTVFLRLLLDAEISLYELVDAKPHYFIKGPGEEYTELIHKVVINDGYVHYFRVYRDQLNNILARGEKRGKLDALLVRTNYSEKDLVKAVEKVNQSLYGRGVSYKAEKLKQPVTFFAGAGMVYSMLKYSGDKTFPANLNYSNSFQPLITGGIDLYIGRNHQRMVLRFELTWYSLKYEGNDHRTSADSINYRLKLNNITPSFSLLYNIINNPKGKFYIGGGLAYNFSSYPENDLTRKFALTSRVDHTSGFLDLEKSWLAVNGKLGYVVNNRIEIAASMKLAGLFSSFSGLSLTPSIYGVSVHHRFSTQ